MSVGNFTFVKFRDRVVQFLILGFIFFAFFIYHYTTSNEIYQMTIPNVHRRSPGHVGRSILNASGKVEGASPGATELSDAKNIQEPDKIAIKDPPLTEPAPFVTEEPSELQNLEAAMARTFPEGSVGAVYRGGHFVRAPEKCPDLGVRLKLLILITSAPGNEMARRGIRQTWGHFDQRKDVSVAFILGETTDPKIEALLGMEQEIYGDIIRGDFIDSYSNLTLKTVSALSWVCDYCPEAKFVLKTDDDMFINVPRLLAFISLRVKDKNVIFGRLARDWKPFRNKDSKYYLSEDEFAPAQFPPFTTGPAYLMSSDVVPRLFDAALDQPFMKLEDVFMTGIVAEKLGIARKQANGFLNEKKSFSACNVQRSISIHKVKYNEQFDLWKKLLDGQTKCK